MDTPKLDEEAIFNTARQLQAPTERQRYLDEACGADPVLRARVDALLRVFEQEQSFLESPAVTVRAPAAAWLNEGPGTQIGPYKLLEKIGEGGFGAVFRAEQQQPLRRVVALKVLKPGMDTHQVVARFEAERQALALMDHPNIARVLDGGATPSGRPYFVMELVKGVPITHYCDEHHLPPRQRLELFAIVCQAVQHAHQKGIIHRDLKPTNVLIASFDGKPVPKLIDFGIAKALGQRLTDRTLVTGLGSIIGTLDYMSPEQAEFNALDVDTRADIYSLGVLLYELLTGTTPLTHERLARAAMEEALRLIREEDPPKPSSRLGETGDSLASISAQRKLEPARLTKEIRGDLDWIVMKALEKDRNRRYATPGDFALDVERYLHGEAIQARPPSAIYRLTKFAQRRRGAVIAIAAVALALLLGTVVATWQAVVANEAKVHAQAAARAEKDAKVTAVDKEAETAAVLRFVQDKVFSAARPEGQEGGLGPEVTLRRALEAALPDVQRSFAHQPLVEARLRMTLGTSFLYLSEPRIAAEQFERARAIYLEQFGRESALTLESVNNLATAYADMGREPEALRLREETLALRRATLGPDHVDTLGSMRNLASSYAAANRRQEALELDEKAFELLKAKFGPDDPSTLASMNNLALSYGLVKKFKEALALQKEAYDRSRAVLPPDHPDTLRSMGNLAKAYEDLDQHDEARKLQEAALGLRQAKMGVRHANTIQSMYSLAKTYASLERYEDALKLHREALALRKEKLPADHHDVLFSMWGVAFALDKLNRTAEALPMIDDCLRMARGKKYTSDFFGLADLRMRYFKKKNDVEGCRSSAVLWEKMHSGDPISCYDAACFRAITAAVLRGTDPSPAGARQADLEADQAMAWLQKAVAAGFNDAKSLKQDEDLTDLRTRADFKKLVADVEAVKEKK